MQVIGLVLSPQGTDYLLPEALCDLEGQSSQGALRRLHLLLTQWKSNKLTDSFQPDSVYSRAGKSGPLPVL